MNDDDEAMAELRRGNIRIAFEIALQKELILRKAAEKIEPEQSEEKKSA